MHEVVSNKTVHAAKIRAYENGRFDRHPQFRYFALNTEMSFARRNASEISSSSNGLSVALSSQ